VRGLNDPIKNHACKVVMASSLFCRTSKSSSGHGPDDPDAELANGKTKTKCPVLCW
jgi:hypothetical protein